MSLTSTDLSDQAEGYTQPKHPTFRITYEYFYLKDSRSENPRMTKRDRTGAAYGSDIHLASIMCQDIVQAVPDTHPCVEFLLMREDDEPQETRVDPRTFRQQVKSTRYLPQTIMAEIYGPADPNGLGIAKHSFLPFIRYVDKACKRSQVNIYKIERIA